MSNQLDSRLVYFYEETDEHTCILTEVIAYYVSGWRMYCLGPGERPYVVACNISHKPDGWLKTLAELAPRAPRAEPVINSFINDLQAKASGNQRMSRDTWQAKMSEVKSNYATMPTMGGTSRATERKDPSAQSVNAVLEPTKSRNRNVLRKYPGHRS